MRVPIPYATDGNRVELFTDGDEAHASIMAAIEAARHRVWVEVYIFEPDLTGMEVLGALERAARRGCDVILLIDRFGAKHLRDRHVEGLREAGGFAFWFNPLLALKPHSKKVTLFGVHRDHRKIVVVDDGIGYTGGQNVSLQWSGPGPVEFIDTMLRLEGPAVRGLAAVFLETLGDTAALWRELPDPAPALEGGVRTAVHSLDLREKEGDLDRALVRLIQAARREVLFCTPYFIPPRTLQQALLDAADRGVSVYILTAGETDVPWARAAARHLYADLLGLRVRIFEHYGRILHAKFFVADRARSIVGSYNADVWGQRYNQEVAVSVEDEALAGELAAFFQSAALEQGREITRATLRRWSRPRRLLHGGVYRLARLLTRS